MLMALKRGIIVAIGLLLQILLVLFTYLYLGDHITLINIIYQVMGFLIALGLIKYSKSYSYTLPWIVIILLFPLVGTLLYIIIGYNKKSSRLLKHIVESEKNIKKYLKQDAKLDKEISNISRMRYITDYSNFPVTTNNDVAYYKVGELAFPEMIKELKKAKKFIFLEYFIIAHGKMWDSILEVLKDKVKVLNDEIDPIKYIKDNLEEYKMSDKDIVLLIKYKNKDITAIDNELCKLKAYKLDNKEITKEDIENIVIKAKEEEDQLLFSLVDSIITKNKKLALENLNSLKEQAIDPFSIIALLDNQLRTLLQTYILREEGKKEKEITDILKIHPYRVKLALNNSYNYTRKEIENTILELAKLDYNIKSGREDKSLALDMFIINLKDKH